MAARRRRIEGSAAKAGGEAIADSAAAQMEKFKSLARRLLQVPRDELATEQRRAAETKIKRRAQNC